MKSPVIASCNCVRILFGGEVEMHVQEHKKQLVHILQMAYSGEKAAALAYAGHWRAVQNPDERESIARIEREEWEHRAIVGGMLQELSAKPILWRELVFSTIGTVIFVACFFCGWYLPMYFAGLLEHDNVNEYSDAAIHAAALGFAETEAILLQLADVEKVHEDYFNERTRGHYLTPMMARIFGWGAEVRKIEGCPILISTLEFLSLNRRI